MGYVFDGVNKIIQLTVGTTELDVKDLYSKWKEWMSAGGSKFLPAFSTVGGEPIDESRGVYITSYFFLLNGWRIRPQEANHRLRVVNGVLLTDTGDSPFVSTLGNYNVTIEYSQPVRTETARIETGVSGLTPEESNVLLKINDVYSKVESNEMSLALLLSFIKNKKYLAKENGKWWLIIRNDTDTEDILRKELKDVNGNPVLDIKEGMLAVEEKSVV